MEDYLEMIYRKVKSRNITIKELSESLNVKASSVSKMINKLKVSFVFLLSQRKKLPVMEDELLNINFSLLLCSSSIIT